MQLLYIPKFSVFLSRLLLNTTIFHIIIDSDVDVGWVNAVCVLCLQRESMDVTKTMISFILFGLDKFLLQEIYPFFVLL